MDDKAETQVGTSKDVIQANPPTIVEILPSAAKPATVDKKKLFLAGRGGLGEEIGRGREKTARRVGTEMSSWVSLWLYAYCRGRDEWRRRMCQKLKLIINLYKKSH